MLKLVFFIKDCRLKVRLALPEDNFTGSCQWNDELEFIVSDNGDFTMVWTSLLPDLEPHYAEALVSLVSARYPISPRYHELKNKCPRIIFKNPGDEWVFFGGSFNPWHQGHQSCLRLLPEDKVCLILPDRNPQKELQELSPVSALLGISTKVRLKKYQYLVPTFLLEDKKNPTVEWVEKLKDEFPTYKLSLLLGFDSFAQMKTWIRPEDLLPRLDTLYVVSRLEDDEDRRLALDEVHALSTSVNVIFLGKHEFEGMSSTEIRRKSNA
ncbi:MAG: nicotinate-nicotinamide nucleotide adenylyltransferase [Bacteriovoracia bacterium]